MNDAFPTKTTKMSSITVIYEIFIALVTCTSSAC